MKKEKVKGFTLIEMLVIIAIIGILFGIVLVVFPKVRQSARDARITSDLIQLQNLAENIYLDEGNYTKVCCGLADSCDAEIVALCQDIREQGGSSYLLVEFIMQNPVNYCAKSVLNTQKDGDLTAFCVDSKGLAKELVGMEIIQCHDAYPPLWPFPDYTCD